MFVGPALDLDRLKDGLIRELSRCTATIQIAHFKGYESTYRALAMRRLQSCAMGEIELTMQQIRAIEILLRKSIPDLAAAEIKSEQTHRYSEQTHRYVVEVPPVLDRDEWQRKYGQDPSLPPPSLQ
jgi:hypothetical protein